MFRSLPLLWTAFAAYCSIPIARDLKAAESGDPRPIELSGLIDLRFAIADDARGWGDRGLGKARYGGTADGNSRTLARAEGSLIARSRLTWDISAIAHAAVNPEQRHGVDVIEAFLLYKPAPASTWNWRGRAGAFFPALSLENTALAWTSPFTISSSAINSWIGEELRSIGIEATLARSIDGGEFSLSGATFGFNDPAGSVLAWRGWAIHDRETGLSDRLPLVALPNFTASGSAPGQVNYVRPVAELDNRIGYYATAQWKGDDGTILRAMYYDNQANTLVFDGRQYAWSTTFGGISGAAEIGQNMNLVFQAISGRTVMAAFPTFTVVDNNFSSASLLVSYNHARHRFSTRVESFQVQDRDFTRDDPNGERGRGLTLAYIYRPRGDQRLTLEVTNVRSTRASRAVLGLPARANETLAQLSYRYFFGN